MKPMIKALTMGVILASVTTMTACNNDNAKAKQTQSKQAQGKQAQASQEMPPAMVDVQVVELGVVPIIKSYSGRVEAFEVSDVRPQTSGIIDEVLFDEGSYVKKGQPLYRINRDNYVSAANSSLANLHTAEAGLASAKANLVAQEANLAQARVDFARMEHLIKIDAVSRQMYDQHLTAVKTAQASVESAKAGVQQAQANINSAKANKDASSLDISRTIVRAPISGKIGISSVTAGALVSASQSVPLATITRTDMVYVDISQSSSEVLRLRQRVAKGEALEGSTQVQIVLEDGEIYPALGQLALSDVNVNKSTGAVTVRAVFPNPHGLLIPGMYVNANLAQSMVHNAVLLPQSAIIRTPQGNTQVYIVNDNKQIEVREVTTAGTHQGQWVVSGGLKSGDMVVVVGGAKVKPEQVVEPRAMISAGKAQSANGSQKSVESDDMPEEVPEPQAEDVATDTSSSNSTRPTQGQNSVLVGGGDTHAKELEDMADDVSPAKAE